MAVTTALYSLRTDPGGYRITKFVDGEPEGSYLVGTDACECPAGHRHTCRHRQMLPTMLAHGLCDSMWFFAFDTGGQVVDFNGTPKRLFDELAAIKAPRHTDLMISPEAIDEALNQHSSADTIPNSALLTQVLNADGAVGANPASSTIDRTETDKFAEYTPQPLRSWRRI